MANEGFAPDEAADWAQREHDALVRLTQTLREHIAAQPESGRQDWLEGLDLAFGRLRAHLKRNFTMQESGGYLDMLLERRPSLANQVEEIKQEHGQLLRLAERIGADLANTEPQKPLLVADICARVSRFIAVVSQHEQRENVITLLVFSQDIGGEN